MLSAFWSSVASSLLPDYFQLDGTPITWLRPSRRLIRSCYVICVGMPSFGVLLKQLRRDRSERPPNAQPDAKSHPQLRTTKMRRLTPPPHPSFLGLPLELRQHIFMEMLQLSASDHLSLLCVCKKIFHEGKEYFYRRPLDLSSQDALESFALSHTPETLQEIKTVHVTFREVDPAAMQPALALLVAGLPISSNQHPYHHEIERVTRSLATMSNVNHLSILRPVERLQNPPSRDFFESVCSWIQKSYTQLQSLELSVENTSLQFLSSLENLRMLNFSGFSASQPDEMLSIMNQFRCLEELRIVGPPQGLRRRQRYGYQHRFVVQSLTDAVLHGMRPLKGLAICEVSVPTHDEPTFLTEDVLKALYLTHRDSLQELSVLSEVSLDPAVESLLMAFLMSTTKLIKLSVGWPQMDMPFFESLPATLRYLELVLPDLSFRQTVVNRLRSPDNRLPHLRSITFAQFDGNGQR